MVMKNPGLRINNLLFCSTAGFYYTAYQILKSGNCLYPYGSFFCLIGHVPGKRSGPGKIAVKYDGVHRYGRYRFFRNVPDILKDEDTVGIKAAGVIKTEDAWYSSPSPRRQFQYCPDRQAAKESAFRGGNFCRPARGFDLPFPAAQCFQSEIILIPSKMQGTEYFVDLLETFPGFLTQPILPAATARPYSYRLSFLHSR